MEDTISIHKRKEGSEIIITINLFNTYDRVGTTLYRGTDIEKAKQAIDEYYDKEIKYINLQRKEDIEKLIKKDVEEN